MAYALVAQTTAASANNLNVTTGSIDTTGADLLLVFVSDRNDADTDPAPTDSKSNIWTALSSNVVAGGERGKWYYSKNPTIGSGHTFSWDVTGTGAGPAIAVLAFSGSNLSAPFDQQTANTNFGTTIAPGSQTPTNDNELIVQGISFNTSQTAAPSVNGGYTFAGTTADYRNLTGNSRGIAVAYLIQGSKAATNPTWTMDSATSILANSASFIAASGGGGSVGTPYYYREYIAGGVI